MLTCAAVFPMIAGVVGTEGSTRAPVLIHHWCLRRGGEPSWFRGPVLLPFAGAGAWSCLSRPRPPTR